MKNIKELEEKNERLKYQKELLEYEVENLQVKIEELEEKIESQEYGFYFPKGFNDNITVRGLLEDLFQNIDRVNIKYLEELVNKAKA